MSERDERMNDAIKAKEACESGEDRGITMDEIVQLPEFKAILESDDEY